MASERYLKYRRQDGSKTAVHVTVVLGGPDHPCHACKAPVAAWLVCIGQTRTYVCTTCRGDLKGML